jgi:hypothetical protein
MSTHGQYKIVATVNGRRFEKVFHNRWDSYPQYLGNRILDFIRKVELDKESFLKRLSEMNFSNDIEKSYYADGMNLLYYLSGETKEDVIKNFGYDSRLIIERIESDFDAFEKGEHILCDSGRSYVDYKYVIDFDEREIEVYEISYRTMYQKFWGKTEYKFDEINEFK